MFIPKTNRMDVPEEIWRFIDTNSFALLLTHLDGRMWGTHLPVLSATAEDGTKYLHAHIARANPQWKDWRENEEALVVFEGPHAYISSSWYDHPNVPTWNYIAVHVYGRLRIIEGQELYESLDQLMRKYEARSRRPVTMEGLPPDLVEREMKAVVGFALEITDIHGKRKLSQNRDDANHATIIHELEQRNELFDADVAAEMRRERPRSTSKG
jgi:transcriptional regulator